MKPMNIIYNQKVQTLYFVRDFSYIILFEVSYLIATVRVGIINWTTWSSLLQPSYKNLLNSRQ